MRLPLLPALLAALTFSLPAVADELPCQGDAAQACVDEIVALDARVQALDPGDAQGDEAALAAAALDVAQALYDAGDLELALDLVTEYVDAVEAGVSYEDAGVTLLQSHEAFEALAPVVYHPGMDPGVPMADLPAEDLKLRINWDKVKWWFGQVWDGVVDIIEIAWIPLLGAIGLGP